METNCHCCGNPTGNLKGMVQALHKPTGNTVYLCATCAVTEMAKGEKSDYTDFHLTRDVGMAPKKKGPRPNF